MSYIGNEPIVSATRTVTEVTATAGQTVFTANGGYTVGFLDVFINGSKLTSADFTATNGTTVTLTEAAQVNDIVRLEALGTFQAANAVLLTGNSNLTGNLNVSGNLGVGTTSPSVKLQVERASNCTAYVRTTSGATTALYSDGSSGWVYTQSNHPLILGTNDAERMRIDTAGRVTMPNQPIFSAQRYSANGTVSGSLAQISFGTVLVNQGSHWNNTTGQFTCPVAGKYFVAINLNQRESASNWMGAYISLNGVEVVNGWSRDAVGFNYQPALAMATISCSANDVIGLGYYVNYSAPSTGNLYNHAVIQLVG